jgi:hypothetical protein
MPADREGGGGKDRRKDRQTDRQTNPNLLHPGSYPLFGKGRERETERKQNNEKLP